MTNTTTNLTIGLLALAALVGCQQEEKAHLDTEIGRDWKEPFFEEESAPRATSSILDTQRARGAAGDGYLYASHFDGSKVNSLGEAKIDAIMDGTPAGEPVVVRLNLPEGAETNAAREEAVVAYLGERGLEADRIQVSTGLGDSRHLASISAIGAYETKEGTIRAAKPQIESTDAGDTGQGMTPSMGGQK
jgi:hypothetical protein